MTAQILSSELAAILYESKKKQTDLRGSVDKSVQDLKSLAQSSESQLGLELRRRVHFASPFLYACNTNNPKLALPGVTCLQRLIISKGLAPERLQETLNAFQECGKTNLDIQLKILQSLPSLLQNYGSDLQGELQADTIELCTNLQQVKSVPVSSTASATLQQVVSSVFDKVEHEDSADSPTDTSSTSPTFTISLELDGQTVHLKSAAHDAFRVLQDICLLLEGHRPIFAAGASLQPPFGLELVEAILTNNGDLFDTHDELGHLLRTRVMPIITTFLSERLGFGITVRTTRILCIILREHLHIVQDECEIPLTILNHLLDSDPATPWRRALCMETFRIIYSAPNLVVDIYALFDEREEKRNLIQEGMSHFVRLASEKPALIGVGSQSSYPTSQQTRSAAQEQAILEANSVAGVISGETGITEVAAPGVSVKWSSMKTPCLEQLDKTESPLIPDTYVYSLVLTCLNNLSEGAAKTVLPLTAGNQSRAVRRKEPAEGEEEQDEPSLPDSGLERRRLVNPLELTDHPSHRHVVSIAHMIDTCWPAILATSSTFLNAALDTDFYRGLIRSVQRFTQIAGLLRLATPRDAFLTTLTKSAVPARLVKNDLQIPPTPGIASPRLTSGSGEGFFGLATSESPAAVRNPPRPGSSDDTTGQVMSQRNLMCLRALINLAIALGSILGESWTIVIESLQKADNILAQSGSAMAREYRSSTHGGDRLALEQNDQSSLTTEIAAVESAVTRLFQSTSDYPNEAFLHVLKALSELVVEPQPNSQTRTLHFALAKLGELARINTKRLALEEDGFGWSRLILSMRTVATSIQCDSTSRLMAADITSSVALGVTLVTTNEDAHVRGKVQIRAIECLETEISTLYEKLKSTSSTPTTIDMDIHRSAVEAVRSILESCGDSLISGWRSTFSIVQSAFIIIDVTGTHVGTPPKPISARIAKSAFACAQLICSDFLASLKKTRVVFLIDIFAQFCSQTADINISLTTLTLFWNLSDFLQVEMQKEDASQKPLLPHTKDKQSHEMLRASAEQGSLTATWMILLEQIATMTRDNRGDVRIGAVQTIFRILRSSADQFDPAMWSFAIQTIVFHMMDINTRAYDSFYSHGQDHKVLRSLHATTDTLLKSWATTVVSQHKHILALPSFDQLWQAFIGYLAMFLRFEDDELFALVFDTLSQILGGLESQASIPAKSMDAVLDLWRKSGANAGSDSPSSTRDEKSLIAYVQALKQMYPSMEPRLKPEQVISLAENVQACILAAHAPQYTSDVESMTTLQSQVLSCVPMLWSSLPGLQSTLIQHLSTFVELPYRTDQATDRSTLSYVALAKGATAALSERLRMVALTTDVYVSGAAASALGSLNLAVSQRYLHLRQGKAPALWRAAALASIEILSVVLPQLDSIGLKDTIVNQVMLEAVQLATHVRETDLNTLPANDTLLEDESFDLEVLENWRKCIGIMLNDEDPSDKARHSPLNDMIVTDDVRDRYARSLFFASLHHETGFTIPKGILTDLAKVRAGRVWDPNFHPRIRMCYTSLDELFAISNEQLNAGKTSTPLATLASPYLILRCALPLQRYIADQPLRGKMPTPTSQRLELLYLLGHMKRLGQRGMRLVPIVNRALACSRHDAEVADALQAVVQAAIST